MGGGGKGVGKRACKKVGKRVGKRACIRVCHRVCPINQPVHYQSVGGFVCLVHHCLLYLLEQGRLDNVFLVIQGGVSGGRRAPCRL